MEMWRAMRVVARDMRHGLEIVNVEILYLLHVLPVHEEIKWSRCVSVASTMFMRS